ncbi:MAG TPA: CBS domain-containing protein [Actinomycetes bacterium]|jgi:CBS domain-containing protein|nr:CBS domain-containing protein [Actinomycetes bacterium]
MEWKVRDVMTAAVVTVTDSAPFKEIVGLMHKHGVSALPVVNQDRRVVGVVSEADLLLKEEYEPETEGEAERYLFELRRRRIERKKATGLVAAQLMTTPVVKVGPDATLREAARLLHERKVKRLPVIDEEGRAIGIVGRGDLLKVFLRPDQEILEEVTHRVLFRLLWLEPGTIKVQVDDGVVLLEGVVEQRSMIPVVVALVQGVDGVVAVNNSLEYLVDDTSAQPSLPQTWGMMPKPYHWP